MICWKKIHLWHYVKCNLLCVSVAHNRYCFTTLVKLPDIELRLKWSSLCADMRPRTNSHGTGHWDLFTFRSKRNNKHYTELSPLVVYTEITGKLFWLWGGTLGEGGSQSVSPFSWGWWFQNNHFITHIYCSSHSKYLHKADPSSPVEIWYWTSKHWTAQLNKHVGTEIFLRYITDMQCDHTSPLAHGATTAQESPWISQMITAVVSCRLSISEAIEVVRLPWRWVLTS